MSTVRKAEETPLWLPGKLDTTLGVVLPVIVEVMVVAIALHRGEWIIRIGPKPPPD